MCRYTNLEYLIENLPKGKIGLVYVAHITQMKNFVERAKAKGLRAIAIWSINNKEHLMTEEQLAARDYIPVSYTHLDVYKRQAWNGEIQPELPSLSEKKAMMTRHLCDLIDLKGEYAAVREMRKHMGWYMKGAPGSAAFRGKVNQINDAETLIRTIGEL